jgi:hypothetical protein
MPKTEPEYCRGQAERLRGLAKRCSDRNIRDQVEAMAKYWADKARLPSPPRAAFEAAVQGKKSDGLGH